MSVVSAPSPAEMGARGCVLSLLSLSWGSRAGCCGAELDWGEVDWGGLGLHPAAPLLPLPFLFQETRLFCFYKHGSQGADDAGGTSQPNLGYLCPQQPPGGKGEWKCFALETRHSSWTHSVASEAVENQFGRQLKGLLLLAEALGEMSLSCMFSLRFQAWIDL